MRDAARSHLAASTVTGCERSWRTSISASLRTAALQPLAFAWLGLPGASAATGSRSTPLNRSAGRGARERERIAPDTSPKAVASAWLRIFWVAAATGSRSMPQSRSPRSWTPRARTPTAGSRLAKPASRIPNPESRIPALHPYRSVAATSASTLAGSKAEWPASAVITSSASGNARFRSQAFWIGQTTS